MKKNLLALCAVLAAAVAARPALSQEDAPQVPAAGGDAYEASAYVDPAHVMVGDMIVDVAGEAAAGDTEAGFALKGTPLWPGGVLPLSFSPQYTPQEKASVFAACAQWSRRANVRCVERTNETRFVSVIKDPTASACYAHLGYNPYGGQMSLNLGPAYCWEAPGGRIMHELGHLLGLRHEQTRPDRDQFITMHWENMTADPFARAQYAKAAGQPRAGRYDFESIMHYGPGQCAAAGRPAFTVNAGYERFQRAVGQRRGLSQLDGEVMAGLYGPPGAPANVAQAEAPEEQAPELVADQAEEPALDPTTVGQQLYAEAGETGAAGDAVAAEEAGAAGETAATDEADKAAKAGKPAKAAVDAANLREIPLLAWTLQLVTDLQYKDWRDGVKPSAEAAKFLKPARAETLRECFATLARAALKKEPACAPAAAFLKEDPAAGQASLDPKDFPLGRWRRELWGKSAYGAAKSKAALAVAASHRKAAGLWNDGKLCEAAGIFATLAPRRPAAAPAAPVAAPAKAPAAAPAAVARRASPFGRRKDALTLMLRAFSGPGADRLYPRFYAQGGVFAKMDAACRTRYAARGSFLQSTSLSLAAFEYRECIQSGADAPARRKAEAAVERLRQDAAAPLLLDPYLQSPRACLASLKAADAAVEDADADSADASAGKTTAAEARIRKWLKMTEAASRFSQRADLKTADRVRAHCSLARGYERLAGMYAGLGAARSADEDAAADEDRGPEMSDEQAADALAQETGGADAGQDAP